MGDSFLGTYPLVNGPTYGEPMLVEESGNMIILTEVITKTQGDASYPKKHWKTLTSWVDYLTKEGLDPKTQLGTDDFAGHLARNANLILRKQRRRRVLYETPGRQAKWEPVRGAFRR